MTNSLNIKKELVALVDAGMIKKAAAGRAITWINKNVVEVDGYHSMKVSEMTDLCVDMAAIAASAAAKLARKAKSSPAAPVELSIEAQIAALIEPVAFAEPLTPILPVEPEYKIEILTLVPESKAPRAKKIKDMTLGELEERLSDLHSDYTENRDCMGAVATTRSLATQIRFVNDKIEALSGERGMTAEASYSLYCEMRSDVQAA